MVFHPLRPSVRYGVNLRWIKRLLQVLIFVTCLMPVASAVAVADQEPPALDRRVKILALGDSLTAGYGLRAEEGLVPQINAWLLAHDVAAQVLNGGVSGDTSAAGRARLGWSLTPDVEALVVTLGGNDLLRGLPPAVTRANIEAILDEAQRRGLPTLLIGMNAPGNFGLDYKEEFDRLYPELAAQYGTLYAPSFFALIDPEAQDPGDFPHYMQADGLHPNAEGVKEAVGRLGPYIEALAARVTR